MNYRVRVTRHALTDLQEASDYIEFELFNPDAASNLLDKVDVTVNTLQMYPERYPLAPDKVLRNWKIRFVMVNDYYLFFTIREDTVFIVRFLHKRRDWMSILAGGLDLD